MSISDYDSTEIEEAALFFGVDVSEIDEDHIFDLRDGRSSQFYKCDHCGNDIDVDDNGESFGQGHICDECLYDCV